jgi:tRNA(Ile)-lysidine synthase
VRAAIEQIRGNLVDVTEQHIKSICGAIVEDGSVEAAPARLTLPHGIDLFLDTDVVVLSSGWPAIRRQALFEAPLSIPGEVVLATGRLSAELLKATSAEMERLIVVCGPYHALVDAEAVRDGLTVGPRRKGDRFRPLGMNGTKKLQDLFVDRKVPEGERDEKVIVRNADHVVWIPGEGLDERVAVRASTERLLHLTFRPKT